MDEKYMRRALELAARGIGRTRPNPAVGAVVVREGRVVGEGWHRRAGEPHAEPIALLNAGEKAVGGTIYVTLEPCSHWGRTPPCTQTIIEAGIKRVVFACVDCDKRCEGKAESVLTEAGIEVVTGLLEDEARRLNEAYLKHKATGLPFVTLKMACSLDGKIATSTGDSHWVTGPEARAVVHQMRDRHDAVMVGVGTLLADDPQLTTRTGACACGCEGRDAERVIMDTHARTPADAKVISQDSQAGCTIAVGESADKDRVAALQEAGAGVMRVPQTPEGRADLRQVMYGLGAKGFMSVLIEGGGTLAAEAVREGLVDKVVFFYAPKLVGGKDAPTALDGAGVEIMNEATRVDVRRVERVGDDIMLEGYLCSRD